MENINKYSNGKIYKIVDLAYTKTYYGSTINSINKRFRAHKEGYNNWKSGKRTKITVFDIFDEFGIDNCKIELVELYPCNLKIELERKEGEYIKNNDCVNKIIAGRTQKEYKEDNKEHYKEYFKKHYEENKEEKLKYAKDYRSKEEVIARNKGYFKEYAEKKKEELKEYRKKYAEKNKEKIKLQKAKYYEEKKKYKEDREKWRENIKIVL
jgi:hypothetical protein